MVSETVSKKAGRPKAVSEGEMATVRALFPNITTTRGQQNQAYANRAFYLFYHADLVDADRLQHFLPPLVDVAAGTKTVPMTLLSHLGRLHPSQAIDAAEVICDQKMSTKEAILLAKRMRGVERKVGSQFELLDILAKTIDRYAADHECTAMLLEATLESLSEIVSETHGGDA